MEVTYTVYVYIDDIQVGEGVVKLIDEYEDSEYVKIATRDVSGEIVITNEIVGSVMGRYVDYITYYQQGTRTYVVRMYTYIDNVLLLIAGIEHQDRYGSLVGKQPEQPVKPKQYPQPWALLLPLSLSLIGVYMYTRRNHEE